MENPKHKKKESYLVTWMQNTLNTTLMQSVCADEDLPSQYWVHDLVAKLKSGQI